MAVFLQATLELDYQTLPIFLSIAPTMKAEAEAAGWTMLAAMTTKIGKMNTVVHLWKLADMNAFDVGIAAMASSPHSAKIYEEICKSGAKETLAFLDATSYSPAL